MVEDGMKAMESFCALELGDIQILRGVSLSMEARKINWRSVI